MEAFLKRQLVWVSVGQEKLVFTPWYVSHTQTDESKLFLVKYKTKMKYLCATPAPEW